MLSCARDEKLQGPLVREDGQVVGWHFRELEGWHYCADKPAVSQLADSTSGYPEALEGITDEDVLHVQASWASAIKTISKTYKEGGDYFGAAGEAASQLYAYGHSAVLFKPTKASKNQFRPTGEEALSYFVGGSAVDGGYEEDSGFAINSGKGWSDVVYDNHQIVIKGGVGIAMGNYYFTCMTDGSKIKVEYTFGYARCDDGKVRIFLHHSSVPYSA